jgi:hypothetical protein
MTSQLLHSEFPYILYEENWIFFVINAAVSSVFFGTERWSSCKKVSIKHNMCVKSPIITFNYLEKSSLVHLQYTVNKLSLDNQHEVEYSN